MRKSEHTKASRVRQVTRWLRVVAPPPLPVQVKWVDTIPWSKYDDTDYMLPREKKRGIAAQTSRGKRFTIALSKKRLRSQSDTIETLLHEWAHCVAWGLDEPDEDHGAEWGRVFAQLYTLYYDKGGHALTYNF